MSAFHTAEAAAERVGPWAESAAGAADLLETAQAHGSPLAHKLGTAGGVAGMVGAGASAVETVGAYHAAEKASPGQMDEASYKVGRSAVGMYGAMPGLGPAVVGGKALGDALHEGDLQTRRDKVFGQDSLGREQSATDWIANRAVERDQAVTQAAGGGTWGAIHGKIAAATGAVPDVAAGALTSAGGAVGAGLSAVGGALSRGFGALTDWLSGDGAEMRAEAEAKAGAEFREEQLKRTHEECEPGWWEPKKEGGCAEALSELSQQYAEDVRGQSLPRESVPEDPES